MPANYRSWIFSRCCKPTAFLLILLIVIVLTLVPRETLVPEKYISLYRQRVGSPTQSRSDTAKSQQPQNDNEHNKANGARQHTAETANQVPKIVKPYDIVVNSYMRSGSSFTGQLLAYHPDTFYWYEPLWNYDSGLYYWGKNGICSGSATCSFSNVSRGRLSVKTMHEALTMIYQCKFQGLVPAVAEKMTPSYSGKVWTPYIQCRSMGGSVATCLTKMEEVCRMSKHRATKIVRFTADNLEYVLENHPNVKVIHLLRDPRAIINSRITTKWYSLRETPHDNHRSIRNEAKGLCSRMAYDIHAAIQLKKKYPDRFALVMYEDLQNDLKRKSEILYDFFGLDKTPLKEKLENMTDILPDEHMEQIMGDHTNWWRFRLMFSAVKAVDDVCSSVCNTLGYRIFTDDEKLKNNSVSAISFDPQLLLENIDKTYFYDFKVSK